VIAVDLPDLAATAALATRIAAVLAPGDVVALHGGLGTGKTTLARAILAALGYRDEVPSPTFAIIELYEPPALRLPVVHADFYRLTAPAQADEIGLDAYRQGAALLAEWPDRAGGFAQEPGCLTVRMETMDKGRRAIVEPGRLWQERTSWT
jgi:tRNA threonylcarbamoyladenosine biosynthesis protein TsaE